LKPPLPGVPCRLMEIPSLTSDCSVTQLGLCVQGAPPQGGRLCEKLRTLGGKGVQLRQTGVVCLSR